MALAQKTAKASSSPCPQGLTPPGSPTKESAMPPVTLKDLMPLFGVFLENALLDLADQEPPNTPVSQDQSPQGLDIGRLKRLMVKLTHDECASAELSLATKPARSPSASNEQEENVQAVDKIDLESPICTTPDDFKSFEKWASKSQFKTVMETWDKEACNTRLSSQRRLAMTWTTTLSMHSLSVNVLVHRTSEEVVPLVDIKSEGLRDILRDVLHDIKAVSLMEDKPSAIETVLSSSSTQTYHESAHEEHLLLLIDHLKYAYASALQRLESMLQHGHITNDLLWALFKPGCHVYTTCIGTKEPRCVVFDVGEEITQNDETWLNLECRFVDYDGVKFGEAGIFLRVAKFRGSKPIEALEAFPLHQHPNHEQVRKDLIERGQKFRGLAGSHVRHCKGSAFFMNKGKAIKVNINKYSRPSLRDIGVKDKGGIAVFDIGAMLMEGRERKKEKMRGDSVDAQKLSEADLLVSCPTVCCFSFKEKMFLECAVSALRDVAWSPESFDCLKIPSETKTILLSLAKPRLGMIPKVPFDDVIDGKGQGFNILLKYVGKASMILRLPNLTSPGVGKAFTVEATSEYFKLPLYSISAGELVVNHGDSNALEQQLETVFKIAKHFNAVLLLDEADAFMEQRTSYHDTHNRLVTIFLRKLEYYQGILFLASNRGIQFDDAIISRIHMIIEYKNLTREFRKDLWSTFLSKACTTQGPAIVEEHELRRLEYLALNGREIKNVAAIAHALAEADVNQVNYKLLKLAAESNKKFSTEFGRERPADGMYV
ncbi:unnamed protein product [Penicillium salamii]|uniref:ATPase AAA-type core domain-containing protein n=1 Tax=Penicillium salamii TaxID=1612424 RepID=A0A9W4N0T7_9EURO|nr:unnamed protein product [Penicillium salamii]CAG7991659.1 unnamed protein product [Penicillium nalgiovense]CAG7965762.1 unnamed protein product [Penicillium salamii]CAG7992243.1 unnamed protein product [Penicillium nalgiovense]CAG7992605.1 unnamed protein product [Penicillium nalgiovense]